METGKWTNDKFYSLSQAATYDLDGDGDLDTDDMYGYLGETYNITVSLIASDVFTVQKDENDIPVMLEDKTRMFEALESALTYMNDTNATLIDYRDGLEALERLQKYRDNEALFTMCGMINVIQFRDLVTDFGILPIPKLDEAQEEYYSTVSYVNADAMSVPTTATDLEMIGIVMETFSAESRNTVLPAYYEVALTRKATRDEESRHMIDLIIEGKRYDIGMLLDLGGIYTEVQNMVSNKKTDVASMWASIEKRMAKNLEKMFG